MKNKKAKICFVFLVILLCAGCEHQKMTEEEYSKYIKDHTHRYEVISVNKYIYTDTNMFGAVIDQTPMYNFTYIDYDGRLHEFNNFEHTEYGLWKLCVGDKNEYIVINYGLDTYRYLYLTKETFSSLNN